jgi:hypothetical protein
MFTSSHSLRPSQPQNEVDALLTRMQQRLYPETIPVLASYWLKTVYAAGHDRAWWKELNDLLRQLLRKQLLDGPSRQALTDIQSWVEETVLRSGKAPGAPITMFSRSKPRSRALVPMCRVQLWSNGSWQSRLFFVNGSDSDIPQGTHSGSASQPPQRLKGFAPPARPGKGSFFNQISNSRDIHPAELISD